MYRYVGVSGVPRECRCVHGDMRGPSRGDCRGDPGEVHEPLAGTHPGWRDSGQATHQQAWVYIPRAGGWNQRIRLIVLYLTKIDYNISYKNTYRARENPIKIVYRYHRSHPVKILLNN